MKKPNLPLICIISAAIIIAIAGAVIFVGICNYSAAYADNRAQEIKETIISSIAHCYALEGRYPPDLDYLVEHYGLQLDTAGYGYHYDMFATNVFPSVRVFAKGE